jgi:hypothetical protein
MARVFWAALCVVITLCVLTFPVRANVCAPIEFHVAQVTATPSVKGHLPLSGIGLQRVVEYIQAINGDTAKYNVGYLAWTDDYVALFVGNDGMICAAFAGPVKHLPVLRELAEGRPA